MLKIIMPLLLLASLWSCSSNKMHLSRDNLYPNLEISLSLASNCVSKSNIDGEVPIHMTIKNRSLDGTLHLERKDFGFNRYDENGNFVTCGSETIIINQNFVVPANSTRDYILYSSVLICSQPGDRGLIKLDMVKGKTEKPIVVPYLICEK